MKKIISVLLAALLLVSCFVPAGASSVWDAFWADEQEAVRGIIMQPGATEAERNFSWYMDADVTACSVLIDDEPTMTDAAVFTGTVIDSYQGDKVAKVTVRELELGETYYYTCVSGDEKSSVYSFETVEADSFSALYISDIHISGDSREAVQDTAYQFADLLNDATARADVNLILSAGDQASDGLRCEYEGLTFSPLSRSLSFATSIGNHDRKGVDYRYFTNLPNEDEVLISSYQGGNYYFVKGDVLFLCLDSNNASGTDHYRFVKNAVKENPDCKWRVVVMHHDLYGGTLENRESENRLLRLLYSPIMDEFNIDLALLGHSHHYSVSDVVYNGKSVADVENGGTVENAQGTVYMVSASVSRPRDEEGEIPYSDLIAIGMDEHTDRLYNIIDFSSDAITVTTYEVGSDEVHANFTLTKTEEYDAPSFSFFRKLFAKLVNFIGTIYAVFNNMGVYSDLKEDGYDVPFFDVIF
ncbi:MAG: hypothetical protein E7523_09325 [Ruminococcaceae bacterium]|nr:hypothetical protein [Oscillospiraceae bacterium]